MNTKRVDGWSDEEEFILADLILRMIRTGGTQSSAFQEAGQKLKRTPTACSHRWNRLLRKKYATQIEDAKTEWTKRMEQSVNSPIENEDEERNSSILEKNELELLISELREFKKNLHTRIGEEESLANEIRSLRDEMVTLTADLTTLQNEYRFLLEIIKSISKQILHGKNSNAI